MASGKQRATFSSFEESTAEDWATIAPQLNVTQSFVPDRVMALMRDLKNDHGGFPVDRLEHSLQTATRAERDGRDEEYVLCALLHDIGGHHVATTKKYRDVQANPWAAMVVDDLVSTDPWTPRMLEIRGRAEAIATGGSDLGPGFGDAFIRLHPEKVNSFGIE